MRSQTKSGSNAQVAERVRSILDSKNLTLYQASLRSATLFGRSSPYFLPHNLYYDLGRGTFSPSLFQMFALSRISNYRFDDWLRVFGFDLEAIPRLQIQLPSARTVLLDSSLDDPNALIPWFRNSRAAIPVAPIIPLSHALEWTMPRRLSSFAALRDKRFLYIKIGYQDVLAFPELLAGSLVRVNPRISSDVLPKTKGETSRHLFLIEHRKGLFCSHICFVGDGRIAPVSAELPYAQVEFKVPDEATLVGIADLEIRRVLAPPEPKIAKELAKPWKPAMIFSPKPKLASILRSARLRMGLSFRTASAISREVANFLGDERYFISPGALSDYEALDTPPRHFHKFVSFCLVYCVRFQELLGSLDIHPHEAGIDPIPDRFIGRPSLTEGEVPDLSDLAQGGVLGELVAMLEEVPFFLRGALTTLSSLTKPSLRDFFWIGGTRNALHPYLVGGILAIVNRHKKRSNDCRSKPLWQQPLFVVLRRDGTYLCGCCSQEDHHLVVHSYAGGSHKAELLGNRDAEIIGQIVAVARRLV